MPSRGEGGEGVGSNPGDDRFVYKVVDNDAGRVAGNDAGGEKAFMILVMVATHKHIPRDSEKT